MQQVRIVVGSAVGSLSKFVGPAIIADGQIRIGPALHGNLVPMPIQSDEPVSLKLQLVTGEILEQFPIVRSTAVMVLLSPGGGMAPYSMDLRTRVLADWDAGLPAKEVSAKFRVSRSWVNRLVQRRRENGEVRPRQQKIFKKQAFAGQEDRLRAFVAAKPDQTLAELREALQSSASLSSLWRALDRLRLTLKKNGTRRRTTSARRRG